MPEETAAVTEESAAREEPAAEAGDAGLVVEVEREHGKAPVNDDDLAKLTADNDDEIARANESAKNTVKGLRKAYQEQRRRAEQWSRDASTASNLAERLFRENQELRQNISRSETALIDQALSRAEAQLEHAKTKSKTALTSGDADLIVAANEDVARAVAEVDRLKVLKPAAAAEREIASADSTSAAPEAAPAPAPMSERTRSFIAANPWFGKDQEMTNFAIRQHQHLELDGITEGSNPELYWRTIEGKLKETYPEKFGGTTTRPAESRTRPAAVTGGTRSNGTASTTSGNNGKRVVHLTESQVRIASRLGLTPEQYAASYVQYEQNEERETNRRRIQ